MAACCQLWLHLPEQQQNALGAQIDNSRAAGSHMRVTMRIPAKALVRCTILCKLINPDLIICSIADRWTASVRSSEAGASHACLQAAWQADMFYIVVNICYFLIDTCVEV